MELQWICSWYFAVGKLESNICVKHGCRTVSKYNDVSWKTKPLIFQKFGRLPYTIYHYRTHLIQKWDPSDPIRMTIVSRGLRFVVNSTPPPRTKNHALTIHLLDSNSRVTIYPRTTYFHRLTIANAHLSNLRC